MFMKVILILAAIVVGSLVAPARENQDITQGNE